jgi:hypothetical protein
VHPVGELKMTCLVSSGFHALRVNVTVNVFEIVLFSSDLPIIGVSIDSSIAKICVCDRGGQPRRMAVERWKYASFVWWNVLGCALGPAHSPI